MQVITNIKDMITWRMSQKEAIGYVATMGALHEGHLSLIKKSKKNNDKTVVSIFVNPAQFGVNEDFNQYPRTKNKDIELCKSMDVDIVFMPENMYPNGIEKECKIIPPIEMSSVFEGAIRPGHFDGVLRVVLKFFNIIRPMNAYFGKKDAQQLLIIKRMVDDLCLNVKIIGCDIVRDSNNLALSSRNTYLDSSSYTKALKIPNALEKVSRMVLSNELEACKIENIALSALENIEVDYCKIVDFNFNSIDRIKNGESLLVLAVRINGIRLLDNFWF